MRAAADRLRVPLVINARIDSFFPTSPLPENQKRADAISRAEAYWSAGADCVFPPGTGPDDLRAIVAEVGAPVNAGLPLKRGSLDVSIPSRRGTPMEPDNLRRSWAEIRTAAGLGAVRLHDLRHTCVSLLLDLGVPPHIVREIVGHSDIEVTMTIYAHASLGDKRAALGRLGDALG